MRAETNAEHRNRFINRCANNSFFPTKERKGRFVVHVHWTAQDNQRADMLPLLCRHLPVKQPHHAIVRALLVQHLAKKSQVFKRIMLKNQDLFHTRLVLTNED